MREDDFSFEAAILTTDLELFRAHFYHFKIRVFSSDELDSFRQLLCRGHGSRCENDQFRRTVSYYVKKFSCNS